MLPYGPGTEDEERAELSTTGLRVLQKWVWKVALMTVAGGNQDVCHRHSIFPWLPSSTLCLADERAMDELVKCLCKPEDLSLNLQHHSEQSSGIPVSLQRHGRWRQTIPQNLARLPTCHMQQPRPK